jgi:hypothetical protein
MVQLRFLSGRQAGQVVKVEHFPWSLGRSNASDLQLAEAGIWDQHLEIHLRESEGFVASLKTSALGTLNGQAFESARLRNGDMIELGANKLQFWLSETQLRDWRWRERATWCALALLCLAQVGLIYWLSVNAL